MYAFVAVDTATGEFLAARDPFGVKPLYLISQPKGFLFCSEIRPLLDATEGDDVLLLPPGYLADRNFCGRHYNLPACYGIEPPLAAGSGPHLVGSRSHPRFHRTFRSRRCLAAASTARSSYIMRGDSTPTIPGYIAVGG